MPSTATGSPRSLPPVAHARACPPPPPPQGKFYLLHIEDLAKNEYLPTKLKWEAIRESAESYLAAYIPKQYYTMESVVKNPAESTKTTFVGRLNEIDTPMFVCLGWVGRKGPKDDPTVLGSVSDVAMRSCSHPVVVCKSVPPDGPLSYAVCVDDDLERGMSAFEATASLSRPIDTVSVVHCYEDEVGKAKVEGYFQDNFKMEGFGDNISFKVRGSSGKRSLSLRFAWG